MKSKLIKEQAIKHFKNKKFEIENKNKIFEILSNVSYTVNFDDIVFGNGYFIFSFEENSVAWFFLKEFPDWKFGIWLNKNTNGYFIFGEAITLIDKFKPSSSTLNFNNVIDFNNELPQILNNTGSWKKYNENIQHSLEEEKLSNEYNEKIFKKINQYIKNTQNDYKNSKVDTYLKILDRNTKNFKTSPRYQINEFTHKKNYFKNPESLIRTKKIFTDLCNLLEYTSHNDGDYAKKFYLDIDEYLFENLILQNPKDYEDNAKLYNWITDKTFNEYVEKLNQLFVYQ